MTAEEEYDRIRKQEEWRRTQEEDFEAIKEWCLKEGLLNHGGAGMADINVMGTNMSAILARLIRKLDDMERLHGVKTQA